MTKLIGPDEFVLDQKFFSDKGAATKYVTGEGLEAVEGDVARAEVWSPDGDLVWSKTDPKIEDQELAAALATRKAGLYWQGRPATGHASPFEMHCEGCKRVTWHDRYTDCSRLAALPMPKTICSECGLEKIGGRVAPRS